MTSPISTRGRPDLREDRLADAVQEHGSLSGLWSAIQTGGTIWLLIRVGLVLFTMIMWLAVLPLAGRQMPPGKRGALFTYIDSWTAFDGASYLQIAQNGYTKASAAFFPLFPILIHAVGVPLQALVAGPFPVLNPIIWNVASLLVSNACALVALISVVYLVRQEGGDHAEVVAVIGALVAFPLAFFMFAGYTESLMVALTALTLLFARRHSWWAAAATAYLGALTHDPGVLLAVPILWELGAAHGWWRALVRRQMPKIPGPVELASGVVAVLAAPLGIASFFAYLWVRLGTPLARLQAGSYWERRLTAPWTTISLVAHALRGPQGTYWQVVTALDSVLFLLVLAVLVLGVRRIPVSFTLFAFASLALMALPIPRNAPDPLESVGRLLLGVLPAFLAFPRLTRRRPGLQMGSLVASVLVQGVVIAVWIAGGLIE